MFMHNFHSSSLKGKITINENIFSRKFRVMNLSKCKIIFLFQVFDKITWFFSDNAICLQNEVVVMILSSKWGYSDDVIYLHTGL